MSRKFIPVEEATKAWHEDPAYRAAYDALEGEFALASTMIEVRPAAGTAQQQVAGTVDPTQTAPAVKPPSRRS